jgi:energy-coupling factor transporter ATP-binding protein EcfA2
MPLVNDNLKPENPPGPVYRHVGKNGCGKSTLMRLLLALKAAERRRVFRRPGYHQAGICAPAAEHRRVMHNGKLFTGSILSNITVAAPQARTRGSLGSGGTCLRADDIRKMPMGIHTMNSKRRRYFRRAAPAAADRAGHRREAENLIFEERPPRSTTSRRSMFRRAGLLKAPASSSLTAFPHPPLRPHIVLTVAASGDGTYDELIKKVGYFAELVERQRNGKKRTENIHDPRCIISQ